MGGSGNIQILNETTSGGKIVFTYLKERMLKERLDVLKIYH